MSAMPVKWQVYITMVCVYIAWQCLLYIAAEDEEGRTQKLKGVAFWISMIMGLVAFLALAIVLETFL